MSYLTFKIISIVVMLVILLVVLSNRHAKKDKGTADCDRRIMSDSNVKDDKSDGLQKQPIEAPDNADEKDNKIDFQAIHDEMYYVEYKLIPHFIEFFNDPSAKASQIVVTIYENLITLQNNLRKTNPFAFGKVSGEVLGNLNDECLVVFEFPKPFAMPLAKYGAIYINQPQRKFQYWTLEFSQNGHFFLGSNTIEGRANYGQRGDLSKEEFIDEVCHIVGVHKSTLQPRDMICRKNMLELTDLTLKEALTTYSHFVVCFYDFNQPSKVLIPMLDQLAMEYSGKIVVGLYDVYGGSENITAAVDYNITALPKLLFFKGNEQVNWHLGICRREDLRTMFDNLLRA